MQQVASQRVALLALEVQRQLQDLHQVWAVGQDLVAVHASDLRDKRRREQRYRREFELKAEPGDDTGCWRKECKSPPIIVGDSTAAPYQVPPHWEPPHLWSLFKRKVWVRSINYKDPVNAGVLLVVATYWQRCGWWHYSSVAQTLWVTLQGGTKKIEVKLRKQWKLLLYWQYGLKQNLTVELCCKVRVCFFHLLNLYHLTYI